MDLYILNHYPNNIKRNSNMFQSCESTKWVTSCKIQLIMQRALRYIAVA